MALKQTQLKGRDVGDGSIGRADLNVSLTGEAVIRKMIDVANSGVKISSYTGVDPGTGDVGMILDWTLLDTRWGTSNWAKNALKPVYNTSEVSEVTNLYYTDLRVNANARVVTAYNHSQAAHDKTLVGLNLVDNTADANKSVNYANIAAQLTALGNYVWTAASLPNIYQMGIQNSFVQPETGWPGYGSVMNMRTYSGGGGSLQLYTPYGPNNGGNTLKVRFGNYDVDAGNAWTGWKSLWHDGNFNPASYLPLAGGTLTGALAGTSATFSGHVQTGSLTAYGILDLATYDMVRAGSINGVIIGEVAGSAKIIRSGGYDFQLRSGDNSHILQMGYTGGITYDGYPIWHGGNITESEFVKYRGSAYNNLNADTLGNGFWLNVVGNGTGSSNFPHGYGTFVSFNAGYFEAQMSFDPQGVLAIRGANAGATTPFYAWRTVWDSVNFNPNNYLPLAAGGAITGHLTMNINEASVSSTNYKAIQFAEFGNINARISQPRDGAGELRIDLLNGSAFGIFAGSIQALYMNGAGATYWSGEITAPSFNGVLNSGNAHTNGTDGWWRTAGPAGWYNETYAVGIYATEAGMIRTYNNASFHAGGGLSTVGDLTAGGKGTFSGGGFNSLRSLKKIHADWTGDALGTISKFKVRDFNYNTRLDYDRTLGFIVDEIPEEISEYILLGEGRNAVNTYSLHALSFQAHQQTKVELETQAEKIIRLEAQVRELEGRLN